MDLRPRKLETVKEEGWHVVGNDWWSTPFDSVSWSYVQATPLVNGARRPQFCGSLFAPVATSGFNETAGRPRHASDGPQADLTLSTGLSGVQGAMDTIAIYEANVGFLPVQISDSRQCCVDLSIKVDEEAISRGRTKWDIYMENLTSGSVAEVSVDAAFEGYPGDQEMSRASSRSSSHGDLHRSTSTLSSIDLTDSDLSLKSFSLPSTPKGKGTETNVEVQDNSPVKSVHDHYSSPPRALNAFASSFVPSYFTSLAGKTNADSFATPTGSKPKPSSQPTFVNFTFPSLEVLPLPTVTIKKDEHGFYSEAEVASPVPRTEAKDCSFLPPFLQDCPRRRGPTSKTRAMVDRLRSFHNHSHSPAPNPPLYDLNLFDESISVSEDDRVQKSRMSTPSQDEDDDGWINLSEADKASQQGKARRTRNLFLALRKRSDSASPSSNTDTHADEQSELVIPLTVSPISSPSPLTTTDDGWIEGLSASSAPTEVTPHQRRSESRSRSHRKRRLSHAPLVPPTTNTSQFMPLTTLRTPASPPHAPFPPTAPHFPPPAPASYYYGAYPSMLAPAAYTSYLQQLQLVQLQMYNNNNGGRQHPNSASHTTDWFQYPTHNTKPFTTSNTPAPLVSSPVPMATGRRDSLW